MTFPWSHKSKYEVKFCRGIMKMSSRTNAENKDSLNWVLELRVLRRYLISKMYQKCAKLKNWTKWKLHPASSLFLLHQKSNLLLWSGNENIWKIHLRENLNWRKEMKKTRKQMFWFFHQRKRSVDFQYSTNQVIISRYTHSHHPLWSTGSFDLTITR